MDLTSILEQYDPQNLTIASLGGHSALDVCHGAKKMGFKTLVVAQKGREKTYSQYYKTRDGKGCIDDVILVDKFSDVLKPEIQEDLRARNTIFIHNRYFWVYFNDFDAVENDFKVPIYGNRELVKLEERDQPNNQYELLMKADVRIPKIIRKGNSGLSPEEVIAPLDEHFNNGGGPVIVKVNEATRSYERAFFIASTRNAYFDISKDMIASGKIVQADLDNSVIEEFVLGAQINFNYFYSNVTGELELMGTDTRRQTNLDGFLRLDAETQLQLIAQGIKPSMIETGHIACTTKESILEKAFVAGEKFIETLKKEVAPGMIGPFALQGAIAAEEGREEIVIFDVSMRIPGSPGTRFTPLSGYLYGESISYGERIAMELKDAVEAGKLNDLLT
jgi:5-formaminoimidazole-4-carboxamide-1-(beta)-D-ribofuranosyl 5'-monophosphate synthetase